MCVCVCVCVCVGGCGCVYLYIKPRHLFIPKSKSLISVFSKPSRLIFALQI